MGSISKSVRTVHKTGTIRLGTRGSQLALTQAGFIKQQLIKKHPTIDIEITIIQTSGDQSDAEISAIGGKGVFIKELELALLSGDIDMAVHSFKDITARPHERLLYSGFILNERVTDAFIVFNNVDIHKSNVTLATGSMRRQALCAHLYPNIECVQIRGNIETRIEKARQLKYDGLILSTAGLQRLNRDHEITFEPDPTQFIPAPGQGMLAIENRKEDTEITVLIESVLDEDRHRLGTQYYEFLNGIEFNCNLPLGAYINDQQLHVFIEHNSTKYFTFPLTQLGTAIATIKGMGNE